MIRNTYQPPVPADFTDSAYPLPGQGRATAWACGSGNEVPQRVASRGLVAGTMKDTSSLYDRCRELFAAYPLAIQPVNRRGTMRSMILMLQDGNHDGYFVFTHDFSQPNPVYWVWSWPAGQVVDIKADSATDIPDAVANVIRQGVPIPRDGSLFAWTPGGSITSLLTVYTEYTPATPEPSWSVMPLADTAEEQWPPFTEDPLFGHWTWEGDPAGSIVSIDGLVAANPGAVFWVDTKAILGSDCCVVARDLSDLEGHTLPRGRYVYYRALQASKPVPSLDALLTDPGKIDLAPRFEPSA